MRKRKKFSAAGNQNEEMSLQITSMADIFMIILVFLLKSYSSGAGTITPSQGVMLPEGSSMAQMKDALKVEILKDSVLVDQKSAVRLKDYAFTGDTDALQKALLQQRKRDSEDSHLLLLADQRTPYATLQKVMNTAASAGFVDLQLAVVQAE